MNVRKNGIVLDVPGKRLNVKAAVEKQQLKEKKIEKLYEFRKRGSIAEGFEWATCYTPFKHDSQQLLSEGYEYVRTIDV